jgi:hypothetical protein
MTIPTLGPLSLEVERISLEHTAPKGTELVRIRPVSRRGTLHESYLLTKEQARSLAEALIQEAGKK